MMPPFRQNPLTTCCYYYYYYQLTVCIFSAVFYSSGVCYNPGAQGYRRVFNVRYFPNFG